MSGCISSFPAAVLQYNAAMDFSVNLARIQERIRLACERSGRDPGTVELMAVSKNQPPEAIGELAHAGIRLFGESRVQEAKQKIPECPAHLRWHMIGHLQTNKARDAVQLFEMIQGVDSLHLATELQKRAELAAKTLPILVEVNVAGESTKFGYRPDDLLAQLLEINDLKRLELRGLMCMAPHAIHAEKARPVFRRCRELLRECEQILGAGLPVLSMGMSGDFEVAIEEGSTLVRIGSALFSD